MATYMNYVIPTHLYRFRSGDHIQREMKALRNNKMWFSDLFSLNDPMEGYYQIPGVPNQQELGRDRTREIAENKLATGICCFTDTLTSGPFWGQYAKDAAGFCIEYDVAVLLKRLDPSIDLVRMYYANEAPTVSSFGSDPQRVIARTILSHKSKAWQHESEWRLLSNTPKQLVSYGDSSCVSRIFVGPYAKPTLRTALTTFCSRLRKQKINLLNMKVNGYSIEFSAN